MIVIMIVMMNLLMIKEHEKLIKNYLNDHDILQTHKTKIDMFNVEKSNFLEKKNRFLDFEHHYLIEKNKAQSRDKEQ